jgi:hypothetical protein
MDQLDFGLGDTFISNEISYRSGISLGKLPVMPLYEIPMIEKVSEIGKSLFKGQASIATFGASGALATLSYVLLQYADNVVYHRGDYAPDIDIFGFQRKVLPTETKDIDMNRTLEVVITPSNPKGEIVGPKPKQSF